MIRLHGRNATEQDGQALVEFALILPLFILMIIGLFDVGRGVYDYNTLSNAARAGLREAIVHQDAAAVEAAAIDAAVNMSGVTVKQTPCYATGCLYSIELTYDFTPATPLIGQLFDPTLKASGQMPVETVNP